MKLKLIAAAAFAVCGSSAFAACTNFGTNSDQLVMECAPQVTVYMAGASAQAPAIHQLLLKTSAVFDLTKAIAIVTPTQGATTTKYYSTRDSNTLISSTPAVATAVASLSGSGAKNTVIYMGTGSTGNILGKRVAVVFNTSNGSFAGVKAMTEGATISGVAGTGIGTTNAKTGLTNGDELSQGLLTAAQQTAGTTLTCVKTGTTSSSTPAVWSYSSGTPTIPSYACTGTSASSTPVAFNYLTTAPTGGVAGVQLALADVAPKQASLNVLTAGKWTPTRFPVTVTGMQGFGIMVNDKALQALIGREVAAGRLPSSCVAANIYGSNEKVATAIAGGTAQVTNSTTGVITTAFVASNTSATLINAACQPSIRSADMNALVRGTATAAMISGNSSDTTTISYYRRVPFSGTQAASNIQFAGQAATEGFSTATLAAAATGYNAPIGIDTTSTPAAVIDNSGNFSYTSTSGKYKNYAMVSGSSVISGVTGAAVSNTYAFGVVSLEKVWNAATASSGISGASWVKLDGISPNYDATGTHDTNQRVGMQAGYPFQFEMVALKNFNNIENQKTVVDAIVTGLQTPSYNLPGIAYIGSTVNATYKANFYRGGSGNNYAPLTKYDTTPY